VVDGRACRIDELSPMERTRTLNTRKLAALAGAAAVLGAFAAPAQADETAVCNEAEASWQDGYTVISDDTNPPARNNGVPGVAMALGNGQVNDGLLNAAAQSPAIAVCEQGTGGGDPTGTDGDGGGDTGGEDGGIS